jgi:pimeloyl-ACP methyl ester carboxylesterase
MENLHPNTKSSSKKIFLILGIGREPENWKHPIETLRQTLPEYEIIALDNPGMGIHHSIRTPLTIQGNLDFLKKKFDILKGDENYLLGWSMGGMIVAQWGQVYPNDMKGIMLMTTSFGALQAPWYRLRIDILPKIATAIFSRGKTRERLMFDSICLNEKNKEMLISEWMQIQQERPVKTINILRQLNACIYFFGKSFKQKHPTLIIGADKDNLVHNKCSRELSRFWKEATYVEHSSAGHDVFNDEPEWTSNEIQKWLESLQ